MSNRDSQAPPTPPPMLRREISSNAPKKPSVQIQSVPSGLTLYSIGNPSDEEQLYLEFINQARANPAAEGLRFQSTTDPDVLQDYEFFGVDLRRMVSQFAQIAPAAPLSMNGSMMAAARLHSQDMLDNQFQGHNGTDGSTLGSRITAQGYDWTNLGENVFSHARSVWHGHAGFNVDWGGDASTGGMQEPPGHRVSIHNPTFREIGIGVVNGTNGTVGPQLVTQDFASGRNPRPFLTGVVYYDLNSNNFYDTGEGIEGVTVLAAGSQFYAQTATSGGYSLPVSGNGAYTVTFQVPGLAEIQRSAVVTNNSNMKIDLTPSYVAPFLSGSDRPSVGRDNVYTLNVVGGAKSYQWKSNRRLPFQDAEGAEQGLDKVSAVTSPGYDVISSEVKSSGNNSFHLAHPPQQGDQLLTLNRVFRMGQTAQLIFTSRLGWATGRQVARAQVSGSGGESWQDVWTQAGSGGRGESSFTRQAISLSPFAGQEIMIRFVYDHLGGNYFPQTDSGVGFYIDEIALADAEELIEETVAEIPSGASFAFNPSQVGDYALHVRAKVSNRFLAWGPAKLVTAQTGGSPASAPRITGIHNISPGRLQIDFEAANSPAGNYELQTSGSITGPWIADSAATIQPLNAGAGFRAVTSAVAPGPRFYRLLAK